MWDPYAMFEECQLDNGLKVYAAQWPDRPWQRVAVIVHLGASDDPVGREGLAHFIEHMTFSNTLTKGSKMEGFFVDLGGHSIGGTTNYQGTHYHFMLPADYRAIAQGLDFLAEFTCNPRFDKKLEHEKKVILSEFRREFPVDFKVQHSWRERKALYDQRWPSRFISVLGYPDSISAITLDDLRSHCADSYVASNMSIVGLGALPVTDLTNIVSASLFGRLPKVGARKVLAKPLPTVAALTDRGHILSISEHLKIKQILDRCEYGTMACLPGAINSQAVDLTKLMIDQVLDREIRQKRSWAYHVGSKWGQFCRSGYEFSINCRALSLNALPDIEKIVTDAIDTLPSQSRLFDQTKRRQLAGLLLWDAPGEKVFRGAIGDLEHVGRIVTRAQGKSDLEQVTLDDVNEVTKWLGPDYRFTVITTP